MGNSGAMLKVKALSSISIEDVELAIGDADQSTAPKVNIYFYTKGVKQRLKFYPKAKLY